MSSSPLDYNEVIRALHGLSWRVRITLLIMFLGVIVLLPLLPSKMTMASEKAELKAEAYRFYRFTAINTVDHAMIHSGLSVEDLAPVEKLVQEMETNLDLDHVVMPHPTSVINTIQDLARQDRGYDGLGYTEQKWMLRHHPFPALDNLLRLAQRAGYLNSRADKLRARQSDLDSFRTSLYHLEQEVCWVFTAECQEAEIWPSSLLDDTDMPEDTGSDNFWPPPF